MIRLDKLRTRHGDRHPQKEGGSPAVAAAGSVLPHSVGNGDRPPPAGPAGSLAPIRLRCVGSWDDLPQGALACARLTNPLLGLASCHDRRRLNAVDQSEPSDPWLSNRIRAVHDSPATACPDAGAWRLGRGFAAPSMIFHNYYLPKQASDSPRDVSEKSVQMQIHWSSQGTRENLPDLTGRYALAGEPHGRSGEHTRKDDAGW